MMWAPCSVPAFASAWRWRLRRRWALPVLLLPPWLLEALEALEVSLSSPSGSSHSFSHDWQGSCCHNSRGSCCSNGTADAGKAGGGG